MGLIGFWNYWIEEQCDPRTYHWFLVGYYPPVLTLLFSYLYFVKKCGPRFMEHRKPYSLKRFIFYYNIYQILANALLVYGLLNAGWFTTISTGCEPVDYSNTPAAMKLAYMSWFCYMTRLVDLVETVIFVLRKKNKQISFLHVYHHISTILLVWGAVRYHPGGMSTFSMLVNSAVHVIMYTYYLLSSQGKTIQRILRPIKPYITIVQMIQFIALLAHTTQMLLPSCNYSAFVGFLFTLNLLINFYLFYDFYKNNYLKMKNN